jgi:hypothetical protein
MDDSRERAERKLDPAERVPVMVLGFLGRAYMLSRGQRRAIGTVDILWGLLLIAAVMSARLDLLSVANFLGIMAAILVLRFAAIKAYLVALRVPASDMPLAERARIAYGSYRGPMEGAMRTLSIASGAGFVLISALIVMDDKQFTQVGALVIGGLAALFAAAVAGDVLVHRYYAKRAESADQPPQS